MPSATRQRPSSGTTAKRSSLPRRRRPTSVWAAVRRIIVAPGPWAPHHPQRIGRRARRLDRRGRGGPLASGPALEKEVNPARRGDDNRLRPGGSRGASPRVAPGWGGHMSKTLLLADGSVTIQKVAGISFANEDVRTVTVDNGDDAVTRAREIRPDIVLADVVMPGKSGYDVCAALKGDPELRGVPVLLLTGTFETFDEDRAARVGADGHITKPFEAQALVQLVNERLAAASAPRAPKAAAPKAAPVKSAPAAAAKPAAPEPEPFDFLEPEETTRPRPGRPAAPAASAAADDAFAFEAEPLDAVELDTEGEGDLEADVEPTQARTALLMDEEVTDAETAPPRGAPPIDFTPRDVDFDDGEELTRLVLPTGAPAGAAPPGAAPTREAAPPPEAVGDPLEGVFEEAPREAVAGAGSPWDILSSDVETSLQTRVLDEPAPPATREDATPPAYAQPLCSYHTSAADEFDLPPPPVVARVPVAHATAAVGVEAADDLPPRLRDQVHETLEKVAWEALGDLSERIVREAVQRIEQVAWDVMPRLAETLIREEIRKLKGED